MHFTVGKASTRFGVSEHTVLHWIHTGQLAAVNVGRAPGKLKPRWRISQAAIDAFETARTATATPAPRRARRAAPDNIPFYS